MISQAKSRSGSLGCGSIRFRKRFVVALALSLPLFAAAPAFAIENLPFIPPVNAHLPKGTQVNVDAAIITFDKQSGVATATGKVVMIYGPYRLVASRVLYNKKTGEFDAVGRVEITEPNGNVLEAQSLKMRDKFRNMFGEHVKALLSNNAMIVADFVKRVDGNITIFTKATYTACHDCLNDKGEPLWLVEADQVTHDLSKHNLYYVNPRLKIAGTTIAALPYLAMPDPFVTRRTGWLTPDFKFGGVYGAGVVTPYFWALSPSTDLTLRPVWTTKQGPVADAEFRQRTETGAYSVRGIGVYQFNDQPYPEKGPWRGAVESTGEFNTAQNWTAGWNGTFATDRNFLGSYGYDGRTYTVNDLHTTGLWDQTYISAKMLNFGSLTSNIDPNVLPYAMPFVTGETITRNSPIGGQFDLTWSAYSLKRATSATSATTSAPFTTVNQGTDQTRATSQLNWHDQYYGGVGTVFTPFANIRGDMLTANNVPGAATTSTTATRLLPEAGFDLRWPFVSQSALGQSVVSPVVQFITSANEGNTTAFGNEDSITLNLDHTNLFLADRFSGADRYEGGTRADIGVAYSLFANNGGLIRASLGQSIHLAGQNSFVDGSGLADNESDFVGSFVAQPNSNLSFAYEARLKNDLSAFNRQEVVASLSFDRFSSSLSYLDFAAQPNYGQPLPTHWVSGDTKFGLGRGWSFFGGMTYDFTTSVFTRQTAGFEFDCRCMNFKTYYVRSQDSISLAVDNRVMMSVELATLGKTGLSLGF